MPEIRTDPGWTEATQRLVLALAVRGDMLDRAPQAIAPQTFSPIGGTSTPPRAKLAGIIAAAWESSRSRPSPEQLEQLVSAERRKLQPQEGMQLSDELRAVLATEVPVASEARWLYDAARQWADYRKLSGAIVEAAGFLERGPEAVAAAREALAKGSPLEDASGRKTSYRFEGDLEERVRYWRVGDDAERIGTSLGPLDLALSGGPTRREVFYFLAPPKGAKTASLLRCALGAARRGFGALVITYEMQALRMGLRLDRMIVAKTKRELKDDTSALEKAVRTLAQTGEEIIIEERPPQWPGSVDEAERRVEQLRKQGQRIDLVVLDYLNIMGASAREREKRHELARVSRDIAAFAKNADVAVWSAALVNRQAVNKPTIRKDDIAEAFEVIAVADGVVAICGTKEMVRAGVRRMWVAAAREEQDEQAAGDYRVDFAKMSIEPLDNRSVVDEIIAREAAVEERD